MTDVVSGGADSPTATDASEETPNQPAVEAASPPAAGRSGVAAVLTPAKLRWLLGGLMLGLFLSSTEQSVVATALPTMAGELGGANKIAWVVSAYLLTSTIVTPLYGKLSDLFGRRIVYQSSIAVFIVGSLLCGAAQTMNQLVAARAVQGAGGGGLMSLAFVILGDVISPRERGRYMGVFTGVFAFSSVSGPLWGGLLVDSAGWRWIFFVIGPIGLVALVVSTISLRLPFATRQRPIDWTGAALLVAASTALILVPIWGGHTFGWTSAPLLGVAALGVVLTGVFVAQERRAVEPIVPLHLFRDRTVSASFAMGFGLMFGIVAVSTFMPLFFQVATGSSATRSGLQMVPQTLGITAMSTTTGFLVARFGRYKWAMLAGPPVAITGVLLLSTIDAGTTELALAPFLVLIGIGLGLVFPNLTLAVQNAVQMSDLGVGTSTANFFRNMGATFGAAVMGALLASRLHSELAARIPAVDLERLGGADGLIRSPRAVRDLPPELHRAVSDAVAGSVTWTVRWVALVLAVVFTLAFFVREKPLRTTTAMDAPVAPAE
ncbi:MAG: MFS transporter [Acidimicrobiia bacterium]|nr:MFS transporter [Acidimicrobiia bacterium]